MKYSFRSLYQKDENPLFYHSAFTLVELLVVLSIVAIVSAFTLVFLPSLMSGQNLTQALSDISQTLDNARTYALANHTYVFVGIEEVDATQSTTAVPQIPGTGRIAVAILATADGTNNYTVTQYGVTTGNLIAISKLKLFSSLHMADFSGLTATTGPMKSRVTISASGSLGNSLTTGTTPFYWPVQANWPVANPQYTFSKVIQYDEDGVASILLGSSVPNPGWIEVGFELTHGNLIPATVSNLSTGQIAAIQIDGISGANRVFRP